MKTRTEIIIDTIPADSKFISIDKNEKYKTVTYWSTEDSGFKTHEKGTELITTSFKWSNNE